MCKAGFAGDDAPRAVFRKSIVHVYCAAVCTTKINTNDLQPPLSAVRAIMGTLAFLASRDDSATDLFAVS